MFVVGWCVSFVACCLLLRVGICLMLRCLPFVVICLLLSAADMCVLLVMRCLLSFVVCYVLCVMFPLLL